MPQGVTVNMTSPASRTLVYGPVPAGKVLVFNLRALNVAANVASVRLSTGPQFTANGDYWEYDAPLPPGVPLINTGEIAVAGQYIHITPTVGTINVRLSGFLKDDV